MTMLTTHLEVDAGSLFAVPANETCKVVIDSMFEMQYEYSLAGYLSQAMPTSGLGMWKLCVEGRLCCTAVDATVCPGDSYIDKRKAISAMNGPDHFTLVKSQGGMAMNMTLGRAVWVPPGYMVSVCESGHSHPHVASIAAHSSREQETSVSKDLGFEHVFGSKLPQHASVS